MSNPREVIARAIAASNIGYDAWNELTNRESRRYSEIADAVIGALEGMGISPEMDLAACKVSREYELGLEAGDALALWQAMVGAMRDE